MNIKELKIQIPEGYEIDKEKSTFEKIVFKPIDTKPRSWEEFCGNYEMTGHEYYIDFDSSIIKPSICWKLKNEDPQDSRNILPSKEYAEAFLAAMQIMSLRQAWIGDWEPDWDDDRFNKYCICGQANNKFGVIILSRSRHPLSFPTREMAEDFMNCFKDLLKIAKLLI